MMRRCEACGGFFDADYCPSDHSHIVGYVPPPPPEPPPFVDLRGRVVRYGNDVCVIVSQSDEEYGLSVLHERVRAPVQDVEEIT